MNAPIANVADQRPRQLWRLAYLQNRLVELSTTARPATTTKLNSRVSWITQHLYRHYSRSRLNVIIKLLMKDLRPTPPKGGVSNGPSGSARDFLLDLNNGQERRVSRLILGNPHLWREEWSRREQRLITEIAADAEASSCTVDVLPSSGAAL